jgi:hypothetical protein
MADGIAVRVLGDYGPFSRMGKSIGYQVTIGHSSYLIDCGSPLFQQIGGHGLKTIKGMIITHCHDDHKRWFTDLALFNMYAPDIPNKVFLLTSEDINEELIRSSGPALDRSLSKDSKRVIDIAYEDYINFRIIGPRAKYRIVCREEGNGKSSLCVTDRDGNTVGPDIAKIVIGNRTMRPRLLFKDPDYDEWIEPDAFYPFSSEVFYDSDRNIYKDPEGFTIEAINAPVWHGIPSIGLVFKTDRETLIFSSDTVHDVDLWKKLYSEKRTQRLSTSKKEFESATVIYGNINDYIERTWSEERFKEAIDAFNGALVIHDIAVRHSVVHTDYRKLGNTVLRKDKTILTHSPDTMTSAWVLSEAGKCFMIKGDTFFEMVEDDLYPLNADIYHKEAGKYYVGYRNAEGRYAVYEKDGLLNLSKDDNPAHGALLYRVDLYEDIAGKYFPKLESPDAVYYERNDKKIELMEFSNEGSSGRIVENLRCYFSFKTTTPSSETSVISDSAPCSSDLIS